MSSKSLLTAETVEKVLEALHKRHARFLRPGERFEVNMGQCPGDAWTWKVTFQNADASIYLPLELAIPLAENPKLKNDEARDLLLDFGDYYFDNYFKGSREVTVPLDWQPVRFGEFQIYARGWEQNMQLERMADRLLSGEAVEDLFDS